MEVKLENLCFPRLLILLSTSTTTKHETLLLIPSKVMSMVTRPPIKKGHKHASGHITVCNLHSWRGTWVYGSVNMIAKGLQISVWIAV